MSTERYISTAQVEDTPVQSLAPEWEAIHSLTNSIKNQVGNEIYRQDKLTVEANKYSVATDILNLSTRAHEEASKQLNPIDSAKTYLAVMKGGMEGITPHILNQNKAYAKHIMAYKLSEAQDRLSSSIAEYNREEAFARGSEMIETFGNEAQNAALRGDKAAAMVFYGQQRGLINKQVSAGVLSPEQAATLTMKAQKEFHTNAIIGQYKLAVKNGTADQFRKNFESSKQFDKYLSPEDKQNIVNSFDRIDRENSAATKINSYLYNKDWNDIIYNASNGRNAPDSKISELVSADPDRAQKYIDKYRQAQATYSITSKYQDATNNQLKSAIAELSNPEKMPNSFEANSVRLAVKKNLQEALKARENDPAAIADRSKAVQSLYSKQKASGKADMYGNRIAYETHLGLDQHNIRVLTNAEANRAVSEIKEFPDPQVQAQVFLKKLNQIPEKYRWYYSRDLQRAGLPIATQYLLRAASDPKTYKYVGDIAEAFKPIQIVNGKEDYKAAINGYSDVLTKLGTDLKTFKSNMVASDDFSKYADVVLSGGGDVNKAYKNYEKHFELLSLYFRATRGDDSSTAFRKASEIMNAGTSIGDYQGSKYIYDKDIDSNTMNAACSYIKSKYDITGDIQIPPAYSVQYSGVDDSTIKKTILSDAKFINTPDQSGIMLVTPNNKPIFDKSGNKIVLTFRQLKDPTDKLTKEILHYKEHPTYVYGQEKYEDWIREHPEASKNQMEAAKYYALTGDLL